MKLSRWLVAAETLILLAPVSVFAAYFFLLLAINPWQSLGIEKTVFLLGLLALCLVASACTWTLANRFVLLGSGALLASSVCLYLIAGIGACIVLTGVISTLTTSGFLAFFALGAPALIPLVHLIGIRYSAARSNNSFKPKPLRGSA